MQTLLYVGIGLAVGALSGVLGIGGGVLLVPALVWLCGFEPKQATGTSLAILVPPIGLPAALEAYRRGDVDLAAALWIAGAFVVGAFASRAVLDWLPVQHLRLWFGLLMLVLAIRFILGSSNEARVAALGLLALGLAWVGFLLLRMLGKRHRPVPGLADTLGNLYRAGHGEPEYHI